MNLSLEQLSEYAAQFISKLPHARGERAHVVGLKGELGAGKTTFVQAVAKALGVKESVTSPTFVIAQVYEIQHPVFERLVHVDAYRLEEEEKDTVGFAEYAADPANIVLVEWPEHMPGGMPEGAPTLSFTTTSESTREVVEHG